MAHRRFQDRQGYYWEVRPRSRSEWELEPAGDNPGRARSVPAPGYEKDPYELSQEELQGLLDRSAPAPTRSRKSPFAE